MERVEWHIAVVDTQQSLCPAVVIAITQDIGELRELGRGIADMARIIQFIAPLPSQNSLELVLRVADHTLKGQNRNLRFRKDMADVVNHIAPAPRLGDEMIEHILIGCAIPRLDAVSQRRGPIAVIAANTQRDPQVVATKGRSEGCKPGTNLAVEALSG